MSGQQTPSQSPFVKGGRTARFTNDSEQDAVGSAHAVPIVTPKKPAQQLADRVIVILAPGEQRVEAQDRLIQGCARGVFRRFREYDGLRPRGAPGQRLRFIGFDQDDVFAVAEDSPGAAIWTCPIET